MTKIDIDTRKVRDAATDLIISAKNYKSTLGSLYDGTLKKMPENKIWYGASANAYVIETQKQKENLEKHAEDTITLTNALIDYIDALESATRIDIMK